MKTGIFGGCFNPVHTGHRKALDAFIKEAELDRVYVIPSFVSPHKNTPEFSASFEDRMEMCRIAFEDCECEVIFSDIERKLFDITGKKSYTVNTLEALGLDKPYLYVGSDMFFTLESWYKADYIFENTIIAVMSREDVEDKTELFREKYSKEYNCQIIVMKSPHLEVSSTMLREEKNNLAEYTSPKVYDFIEKRELYKKKKSREELIKLIHEKRLAHTLAVEKEALKLANIFCPEFKEEISRGAILHDVTKYFTLEEHKELKPDLTPEDLSSPETLHALTGSVWARDVLHESLAVSTMIERHTTASENMTLFDMIIFVADYIEETRTHKACIVERNRLHGELEKSVTREEKYNALVDSVLRILEGTVDYLKKKNSYIHPRTLNAINALRGKK